MRPGSQVNAQQPSGRIHGDHAVSEEERSARCPPPSGGGEKSVERELARGTQTGNEGRGRRQNDEE